MVIEYQINRLDLIKLLYYNIRQSKITRLVIGGGLAFTFLGSLLISFLMVGTLTLSGFKQAFIAVIFFIVGMPIIIFLMAKTQKRWLSINQEGIETKIGSRQGKISWKAVDSIVDAKEYVYITGKNANAFSIPNYAFENNDSRRKFIELATNYHNEAIRSTSK